MKRNILLLINGFGVEQRDSYNVYTENLMPNLDKLTKTCMFSSISSNDLDYRTAYRTFSIGINEALTYSVVNNAINNESYKKNDLFQYLISQLNTISTRLHIICYWDNDTTIYQLITYLRELTTLTKVGIYVHLIMNQKSLNSSCFPIYPLRRVGGNRQAAVARR